MSLWGTGVYFAAIALAAAGSAAVVLRFFADWRTVSLRPMPRSELRSSEQTTVRVLLGILAVLAGSRLLILGAGTLSTWYLHGFSPAPLPDFESVWSRWDAPHYLDLAREGYTNQGDPQNFIVFLPLYPSLVWAFHLVTGNFFLASLAVSNVCLLGAGWLLLEIIALDQGRAAGFRGVCFLALAPFGFFMGLGFTEALFLAVTLGGYWAARKGWWWTAGFFLFLAALTKVQGVLLTLPVFIEFLLAEKKPFPGVLAFGGPALGMGIYLLINQQVFQDPFHFLAVDRDHWYQTWGFFAENLKNQLGEAANRGPSMAWFLWIPQGVGFFLVLGLVLAGAFKLRSSMMAYLLVYTVVSYSPTWLLSGNRYLCAAFPVYVVLAQITRKTWVFTVLLVLSAALAVFFTIGYVAGRPVM